MSILRILLVAGLLIGVAAFDAQASCATGRATGDMGVVIERASGSLLIVEHSTDSILCRVEGLGDLSHASVVYSRDEKYAYVFGRDGGLTKVDIQSGQIEKRIVQGGNSIGGAISQSGQLIAVSNYEPGGVKVFSAAIYRWLRIFRRLSVMTINVLKRLAWWMRRENALSTRRSTGAPAICST